ncbi:unnamed protein product [Didymodactylos carnosus]|uniref:Ion transport domain-containing protein n=1 Tax=Didymodactylos carnosus TaxID=1234261 RepID=A0A815PQX8_9BILA|nr:unnamed protein product [Didymodactylos carnosus]CAF1453326.1 unnamed protein product [Didymodactylos carnosus]CAF4173730.1 unnamed protein product [Didymodactylos carnosus]CAF4325995.1 unnamed protein product [Didymodactylos carnosus]
MIINTMKDMLFSVCFILIFLFGFSITSWSLITTTAQVNWTYTDDGKLYNATVVNDGRGLWTWQYLRDVTNYGIWKVFGQIDSIDGNDAYSAVAWILVIISVAVSSVLLLNVVIALFNVTIQQVEEESHNLWRYQRFLLVNKVRWFLPLTNRFEIFLVLITDSMQCESAIVEDFRAYSESPKLCETTPHPAQKQLKQIRGLVVDYPIYFRDEDDNYLPTIGIKEGRVPLIVWA